MGYETSASRKKAVEDYAFPLKEDPGRHGLFDFSGEIRNIIYEHCAGHIVDIVKTKRRPLLDVHKATRIECIDWFYSENVFLLDARSDFFRWGADHLSNFQNWSSQQDPRHVSMIQHLRIATPAFEAHIHIPQDNKTKPTTVTFEHQVLDCYGQLSIQIIQFYTQLKEFNSTMAGKSLAASDLDRLVAGVLWVAPVCCLCAGDDRYLLGRCWHQVEEKGDLCL